MHSRNLIQMIDAVERPADGSWAVGRGQPVHLRTAGRRARTGWARITNGVLQIGGPATGTSLELSMETDVEVSARLLRELPALAGGLLLRADLIGATPSGRWSFEGRATLDGQSVAVTVEADYQGVYQRSNVGAVWLSLCAELEVPTGRRRRRLLLSTELTAGPLVVAGSASPVAA